jgi:HD-like signal output (HDOD) protein
MNLLPLETSLLNGKFPVLDATLERFALLAEKPTTTNQHLAEIIRSDIGYTLAMFKVVNNSLPATRDPVQSIEHAISMLGSPRALEIGRELAKVSSLPEHVQNKIKSLYSQAFHASQYFLALAIQNRLPHPEETAKNIKMMHLAEVVLLTNKPDTLDIHIPAEPAATTTFPATLLDNDMRELGLALARAWKLPNDLQQSLSPLDTDNKLPLLINLASLIATQTALDWHNDTLNRLIEYWSELTEMPEERILVTLHQLAAETARQIDGRHLPVPAFFLFFPPPPKPAEVQSKAASAEEKPETSTKPAKTETSEKPVDDNASVKPSSASAQSTEVEPSRLKTGKVTTDHSKSEPAQTKAKQQTPVTPKKPVSALQDCMTRQMKNMQKEAGVTRVMFAMLSPDRKKLTVRFIMGGEKTDALRHFQTDLTKKNIFSLLMSKPQSMHLTRDNYKKYLQLIPSMEKKSLQVNNLFAMSVFVKEKAIGLFIADNKKQLLNAEHYKKFKHCCNQAVNDLIDSSTRKES